MITLYDYWRSSAAYRVRIALNLKELAYQSESIHLVKDGGQQNSKAYQKLNSAKLVPTMVDGEVTLNQSLAIIEYLDLMYADSGAKLIPGTIVQQMQIKALAYDIACDIHPLNNLRVLKYLAGQLSVGDDQKSQWYKHWINVGFSALEKKLQTTAGRFCFGNEVSIADLCLIPQVYNANRFEIDLSAYPLIQTVTINCNELPAFIQALPENQVDAA